MNSPEPAATQRPLSLIIVRNPFLSFQHLDLLVDSLNQQSHKAFNTFWIDQSPDPAALENLLGSRANFPWLMMQSASPVIAGVICWELTSAFAAAVAHPQMGEAFAYLHMECLPEQDFVASLLAVMPALKARFGHHYLAMLEQLWTQLEVQELFPGLYWEQLRFAELRRWHKPHFAFQPAPHPPYSWSEVSGWTENAFLMPSALARETGFFSAVQRPLYFQDLFDIFAYLQDRPYWQHIHWIKLPGSVIYHLQHPRVFQEYTQAFVQAIPQHPELFAGLAIFDTPWQQEDYAESTEMRKRFIYTETLHRFYHAFRHAEQGTNHHWLQALDRVHGHVPAQAFASRFDVTDHA